MFTDEENISTSAGSTSSETQVQSVGSGEKAGRKFSRTGKRAPWYRLSPNYFQKFKRIPAPDWAQKMLCIYILCPIGAQFLVSSFREFVHDGYMSQTSRDRDNTKEMHAVSSANFQFDMKSPSDFKILSARKLTPKIQA